MPPCWQQCWNSRTCLWCLLYDILSLLQSVFWALLDPDPDQLVRGTDPDLIPDPSIQGFGSVFIWYGSGSGSSILGWIPIWIQSGSRVLMTENWEKNYSWKIIQIFGSKTTIYLSLGLHKGRPSHRRSLQLSKENIQHFKTWSLKKKSTFLVHFALLDPDPDS